MNNKELTITVSGANASGKSNMIFLLKKFLREQEFEVTFETNWEHKSEKSFDKLISKHHDKAIKAIKETRVVKIREETLDNNLTK